MHYEVKIYKGNHFGFPRNYLYPILSDTYVSIYGIKNLRISPYMVCRSYILWFGQDYPILLMHNI